MFWPTNPDRKLGWEWHYLIEPGGAAMRSPARHLPDGPQSQQPTICPVRAGASTAYRSSLSAVPLVSRAPLAANARDLCRRHNLVNVGCTPEQSPACFLTAFTKLDNF